MIKSILFVNFYSKFNKTVFDKFVFSGKKVFYYLKNNFLAHRNFLV